MNWLEEFKKNDLSFSWSELKIGRFGYIDNEYHLQRMLNDKLVSEYTIEYLSTHENEENPYLWELGSLFFPYDENELYQLLDLIDHSCEKDLNAYYKWRWVLVNKFLNELPNKDYVNALLEISEFWLELKSPLDMPYQYQGIANQLTPQEFYTESHLAEVISTHKNWLKNEKIKLK